MEFTTDTQGNKYFSFEEDDDSYLFEINQIKRKTFNLLTGHYAHKFITNLKGHIPQHSDIVTQLFVIEEKLTW